MQVDMGMNTLYMFSKVKKKNLIVYLKILTLHTMKRFKSNEEEPCEHVIISIHDKNTTTCELNCAV